MTTWEDRPYRIEVKKGEKKSFCSCKHSSTPPFCDGSHKELGKTPHRVTFEEDKTVAICGCLRSKQLPYCDGSHRCNPLQG